MCSRDADVYTSRVSNFLRYTPFSYFRSPTQTLAHDRPTGQSPFPGGTVFFAASPTEASEAHTPPVAAPEVATNGAKQALEIQVAEVFAPEAAINGALLTTREQSKP